MVQGLVACSHNNGQNANKIVYSDRIRKKDKSCIIKNVQVMPFCVKPYKVKLK